MSQKPDALVVSGVQPEHAPEHGRGFVSAVQSPEAQAVAVETAQEGAIVDQAPGEYSVEGIIQGELADSNPHLVVT